MAKRSRGRKKETLYDLSRQHLRPDQKEAYTKELLGESDRAAALVAAAEVESYLAHLLMFKFTPLSKEERDELFFGRNAPLAEFAARINIAYGLGTINAGERDDLHGIRRVRNAFAHSVIPLTFENELIAKECERLSYRNVYGDTSESFGKPKLRYILTALELRKVFFDRATDTVRKAAWIVEDKDLKKQYLAEIDAVLKRDA